jgi:hypothetical protein
MAVTDLLFICAIGILAILATIAVFVWRGYVWISIVSGVLWLLLGFFFVLRTQEGTVLLEFQEYIQLLLLGIGIVMTFSFSWAKAKNMDIEKPPPQDIDLYGDNLQEYNRERINMMKEERLMKQDKMGKGS